MKQLKKTRPFWCIVVAAVVVDCRQNTSSDFAVATSSQPTPVEGKTAMPLSKEEQEIVVIASRLATAAGHSVKDLPDVNVVKRGSNWIVGFTRYQPGVIGGPGFSVVIDAARMELLRVEKYQ